MREPRYIAGSGAPLFDRLADSGPASQRDSRILDRSSIRESVVRDLSRLLNTRAPLFGPVPDRAAHTVLNYGVPDFSSLNPRSDLDAAGLSALIADRISGFEPRLTDIRVTLVRNPQSHNSLIGMVYGNLILGNVREAVSFPLLFEAVADSIEVIDRAAVA